MQRLIRGLGEAREQGAMIVTFAVFLTLLLAFVGLGVDGAALFAKRQHSQTGADAAALALAREYALDGCKDDASAYALAEQYAAPNIPNDDTTGVDLVDCLGDGRSIKVIVSAEQQPMFLGIIGADPVRVPAASIVEWGSPVAGSGFPLAFSKCVFDSAEAQAGDIIELWVPDEPWNAAQQVGNPCEGEDYPEGGFGWLDVQTECVAKYIDAEDGTVWAPGDTGNNDGTGCDWDEVVGKKVLVPIFSDTNGVPGNGAEFLVSQFASFEILGVQIHPGNPASRYASPGALPGWCTTQPTWGKWKKHCIQGRFIEYVSLDDGFEIGPVTNPKTLIIRLRA